MSESSPSWKEKHGAFKTGQQVVKDTPEVVNDKENITSVDVQKSGSQLEGKDVFHNLIVGNNDDDNILKRLRHRFDRMGVELPKIEIRYEHLSVEGDVHVGSRALPTLFNATINSIETILRVAGLASSKKRKVKILHNVSGIVRPSRMTLLLGPPSSGKTTLLLSLAGKLDESDVKEMKILGYEGHRLQLLRDVSGAFRPGILTALVGVTGAGKTTLIDVLAGKKTRGYIEGTISVSGHPKNQTTFARISGYCEQIDIHSPHLTIYESLLYSAWLRLPSNIDLKTRTIFIEEVMRLIELEPIRDAIVGLPGTNGLSIEQRKRLTIAVELVANPSIIFMDEPTSGLDARAAAIVMRTMKNIVNTGRTIVCTIHQPSMDIFEAFDELMLMKRGGKIIYAGPLGDRSYKLIEYFEAIHGVPKIREGYNPATWMLEVTSPQAESQMDLDYAKIYEKSELYQRNQAIIRELSTPAPDSKDLYFKTKYSQPFLVQFKACLWKQYRSYWQNPTYTGVRFFMAILMGALVGLIFWNKGGKLTTLQDMMNLLGVIYAPIMFLGASNALNVQIVVATERTVFYRERAAIMYSTLPFALAQLVIETIYLAIVNLIYVLLLYSMIGYEWTIGKFLYFYYFIFMCFTYHTALGMMLVSLTPRHEIASIFMTLFATFWNLFAGFFLPRPQIPIWWRWSYWTSPVAWTMYGLVTSQVGDKSSLIEIPGISSVPVKIFLKELLGYEYDFLPVVVVAHLAWVLIFFMVFAYSIKFFNFQKR